MNDITIFSIAIPLFWLTMIVECWWIHRRQKTQSEGMRGYELKDTVASLSMGIGYLTLNAGWKFALVPFYYWIYEMRFFEIEATALSWVGVVVLQDFFAYWSHRAGHECRILWAAHVNHHSSEHYNLSTALRQSWSQYLASCLFFIPILLVGFHPAMLFTAGLFHLLYQYWIHTETIGKLGWFEHLFMTPSHHRVHHATNEHYLDRNHGGLLIIWDKLFGTFEAEEDKPIYGLTKNIESFNLVKIAFHEYSDIWRDVKSAKSVKDVLGYIFLSPGWSPNYTQPNNFDTAAATPQLSAPSRELA